MRGFQPYLKDSNVKATVHTSYDWEPKILCLETLKHISERK